MKQREPKEIEVARELRLAKEYWLQTIQPHIAGHRLDGIEWYLADKAYHRLQAAAKRAAEWNNTAEGKRLPVPTEALTELTEDQFREPEERLYAEESLKPEILAQIAASLMNKDHATLGRAEAVRVAHELLVAARRYTATLPKEALGWKSDIRLAVSDVTFAEILRSNEKDSGQLPLLPPVQRGRNEGRLSLPALQAAVKGFLEQKKRGRPDITEEEWNKANDQTAKLVKAGQVVCIGSGRPQTYQEWKREPDEEISDCLQNKRISIGKLCDMRWDRFKQFWQKQQSRALKRKPLKPKKPTRKLPKSAATSPTTAGKREQ